MLRKSLFLLALPVLLNATHPAFAAQDLFSFKNYGQDVTYQYENLWDWSEAMPADVMGDYWADIAAGYHVVLVPGYLSDIIIGRFDFQGSDPDAGWRVTDLGEYFDSQMQWLRSVGISNERVATDSNGTIYENAANIADAIERSSRPVLLVAHSRGGLEAVETLIRRPELRSKVKGMFLIQSPFQGTPVAEKILNGSSIDPVAQAGRLFFHKLGITTGTLQEMHPTVRTKYLRSNARAIQRIVQQIPTVTFGSYKSPQKYKYFDSLMAPFFRNWMLMEYGLPNDGIVPALSTTLPDVDHVIRGGIDHAVTVMKCHFAEFDRLRFMRVALLMLYGRQPVSGSKK